MHYNVLDKWQIDYQSLYTFTMFLGLALCILGILGGIWPPQISMKQTSFYIKFNILIISFVQETVPGVLFGQELFFFLIKFLDYLSFPKMVTATNISTSITKEFYSLNVILLKSVQMVYNISFFSLLFSLCFLMNFAIFVFWHFNILENSTVCIFFLFLLAYF